MMMMIKMKVFAWRMGSQVSDTWLITIPKDHWTLKTGYFEDPTPAIQVHSQVS